MPRKADLAARKVKAVQEIIYAMTRYDGTHGLGYAMRRWVAQMTAVEIHGIWERYAESRLVAALNHNPKHFIKSQNIAGVSAIHMGLALYIVRGGKPFFDFHTMQDLIGKADRLLSKDANPFRALHTVIPRYLDCLAAIRNHVVHQSDISLEKYKKQLNSVYGVKAAPEPSEFLHAKDFRPTKPPRLSKVAGKKPFQNDSRLSGLATVVILAIGWA
jgi:hypothetical protein